VFWVSSGQSVEFYISINSDNSDGKRCGDFPKKVFPTPKYLEGEYMKENPFIGNIARGLSENRNTELKDLVKYYGNKEFFRQKLSEGYLEATIGSGAWFHMDLEPEKYERFLDSSRVLGVEMGDGIMMLSGEAMRIVAVWALYHPDGRVCTFENIKLDAQGWHRPGPKITTTFTDQSSFNQFLQDFEIQLLNERFKVSDLV